MKPAITSILIILTSNLAFSQSIPSLINYQGRLTDQMGAPLAAGAYSIQFKIWDDPFAGNLIWAQQQSVTIQSNGTFNALLGSPGGTSVAGAATNDLTYAFTATNRFLGLKVLSNNGVAINNPSEILPRQQLLSVPFAIQAQQALVASSLVPELMNVLSPAGTIVAFGGQTNHIPTGWLLCDGTILDRKTFTNLFAAIGTSWGTEDAGATSFRVPDLRGVFLRGVALGKTFYDPDVDKRTPIHFGADSTNAAGSFQLDAIKSHAHPISDPGHTHAQGGATYFTSSVSKPGLNFDNPTPYGTFTDAITGPSFTGISVQNQPDGGADTRPINAYVNYIIKY